jgi:putative lipoic acid-binding regulatory protein
LNGKPEIAYPAIWEYRLIARSGEAIMAAVLDAVGEKPHCLEPSRASGKGKFVSMKLTIEVINEDERIFYFEKLRTNEGILHIL